MNTHYGEIVERTIRRNGYSISELARVLKVNRRSVYNWFNQRNLRPEIIYRIGCALRHDFSEEFPHLFTKNDFDLVKQAKALRTEVSNTLAADHTSDQNPGHWKNKYIVLLEAYNNLLLSELKNGKISLSTR